ncbi:MAG: putative membrane protein YczE [Glaciecola sp.]
MQYLKRDKTFRAILFVFGVFVLSFGVSDITSGEAERKGLNSTPENAPFSYYLTIGTKFLSGGALLFISLSPLIGKKE